MYSWACTRYNSPNLSNWNSKKPETLWTSDHRSSFTRPHPGEFSLGTATSLRSSPTSEIFQIHKASDSSPPGPKTWSVLKWCWKWCFSKCYKGNLTQLTTPPKRESPKAFLSLNTALWCLKQNVLVMFFDSSYLASRVELGGLQLAEVATPTPEMSHHEKLTTATAKSPCFLLSLLPPHCYLTFAREWWLRFQYDIWV